MIKLSTIGNNQTRKAASAAVFDAVSSAACITNLFIELYKTVDKLSGHTPSDTQAFHVYTIMMATLSASIGVFDGYVHYGIYSHKRYKEQNTSTVNGDDDIRLDSKLLTPTQPRPMNQNNSIRWIQIQSMICALACSLETISTPYKAMDLIQDNDIKKNNKTCLIIILSLTALSALINFSNMAVMYQLSQYNLSDSDANSVTSNSDTLTITQFQSVTRAIFNAAGSTTENTNLFLKLILTINHLLGGHLRTVNNNIKITLLTLCSVLAVVEGAVRYKSYAYFIKKPVNNEDQGGDTPEIVNPEKDLESQQRQVVRNHEEVNLRCQKKCCMTPSSRDPLVINPLQNTSLNPIPWGDSMLCMPSDMTTISLENRESAENPSQESTTDQPHYFSDKTMNWLAGLCTVSGALGRISAPFAIIALFKPNSIKEGNRHIEILGITSTGISLLINCWNRKLLFNFNKFYLMNNKKEEQVCCPQCH